LGISFSPRLSGKLTAHSLSRGVERFSLEKERLFSIFLSSEQKTESKQHSKESEWERGRKAQRRRKEPKSEDGETKMGILKTTNASWFIL